MANKVTVYTDRGILYSSEGGPSKLKSVNLKLKRALLTINHFPFRKGESDHLSGFVVGSEKSSNQRSALRKFSILLPGETEFVRLESGRTIYFGYGGKVIP